MVKDVCPVHTTIGVVGPIKIIDCKLSNKSDTAVGIRITDGELNDAIDKLWVLVLQTVN